MVVDHINIVVGDLERSVQFYTELLGFELTRRAHLEGGWIEAVVGLADVRADVAYVQPPAGGPRIELIEYQRPEGSVVEGLGVPNTVGLRHLAFRVKDIQGLHRRLEAAGVPFLSGPQVVPGGVVKHDEGQKSLCYFHDPDGVILELAEYV